MTNLALCRGSPSPMLAEWSQLVGPGHRICSKSGRAAPVGQKSQQIGFVLWRRPRPTADPIVLSRARACGRATRSYNFGIFAYLFNSLFDPGKNSGLFHDAAAPSHLFRNFISIQKNFIAIQKFASRAGPTRLLAGRHAKWAPFSLPARRRRRSRLIAVRKTAQVNGTSLLGFQPCHRLPIFGGWARGLRPGKPQPACRYS